MSFEKESLSLLQEALDHMEEGFAELPDFVPAVDMVGIRDALMETARRMQDNYPYHHPMYIGQMLKPPHPVARLAYMLSLWINPNNHALDGGRCSSMMEKEAVAVVARMIGWETHLGHLSSGGTMANLEALWIGRCLRPGTTTVASEQAHYTHERLCSVLGIPFRSVPCDGKARMDMGALEALLSEEEVGTVVVTAGTTATGSVDPLPDVLELQEVYGFRIHVDAAYGGYFMLVDHLAAETRAVFDRLREADSIVIDPHKHGLQPYGCGCVLFRDPSVGRFYKHDSPYTYFTGDELHLGEISLQCSSPGASAVALWATHRLLPPEPGGRFALDLGKSRQAALELFAFLVKDQRFVTGLIPELDIVVWAVNASSVEESSRLARLLFEEAAKMGLHMALAELPSKFFPSFHREGSPADETITCLRACLMKPEHLDWMERITDTLASAADRAIG